MADAADRFATEGLTFDDVLLVPAASDVLPNEVSTASFVTTTVVASARVSANSDRAKLYGSRMQPCDAGYPGRCPAWIAMPRHVSRCM